MVDGVKLPSVTSVVDCLDKGEGLIRWAAMLGWDESQRVKRTSGERGTDVHKFMEEVVTGATQWKFGDDLGKDCQYLGYKAAGLMWLRDNCPDGKYNAIAEMKVWSLRHGYAGRMDNVIRIGKTKRLVDWKTSTKIRPESALQTIAYKEAYNEMVPGDPIEERMVVLLKPDGLYEEKLYTNRDASDMGGFLGLLDAFRWLHKGDFQKNSKEVEETKENVIEQV